MDGTALTFLWLWFDSPEPLITADMFATAPPPARHWLEVIGLLRPTAAADMIPCPQCEDHHVEPVERCTGRDKQVRFFIYCPESLRVEIQPAQLEQWVLDAEAVAATIAAAMSLRGKITPLLPGRLWRLGKTDVGDATREVLMARGLDWPDGAVVAAKIGGGKSVVLVGREPAAAVVPSPGPAVVPLSRIASPGAAGIELDLPHLWTLVRDADERRALARTLAKEDLDRQVEQSMLRVTRTRLDHDVLIEAYRRFGSIDKAAAALVEAGHDTNRDAVYRAIRRAGGVKAVREGESSDSVTRVVASQHRNRGKKKPPRR